MGKVIVKKPNIIVLKNAWSKNRRWKLRLLIESDLKSGGRYVPNSKMIWVQKSTHSDQSIARIASDSLELAMPMSNPDIPRAIAPVY